MFPKTMKVLATFVLLLALGFAPLVSTLTHGPFAQVETSDHVDWNGHDGKHSTADVHEHHDSTNHDHSTQAILHVDVGLGLNAPELNKAGNHPVLNGTARDGPRRPPRVLDLAS